jgi:HK97 gp10 family phage protein
MPRHREYTYEKVEGLDEAIAKLRTLKDAYGVVSENLRETLFKGACIIRDQARANASWNDKTGNTRRAIVAKRFSQRNKDEAAAFAAMDYGTGPDRSRLGHILEKGTVARYTIGHGIKGVYGYSAYRGFMPSYRFFAPAVSQKREEVIELIKQDCQKYVRESVI